MPCLQVISVSLVALHVDVALSRVRCDEDESDVLSGCRSASGIEVCITQGGRNGGPVRFSLGSESIEGRDKVWEFASSASPTHSKDTVITATIRVPAERSDRDLEEKLRFTCPLGVPFELGPAWLPMMARLLGDLRGSALFSFFNRTVEAAPTSRIILDEDVRACELMQAS